MRFSVSRGVFNSKLDSDLIPWTAPKPTPYEGQPLVYHRLFQDFTRRQEAQKRLISILDFKDKKNREGFSPTLFGQSRNFSKSLSKPEVDQMLQRFNSFWDKKWSKIEMRKQEFLENQEKEFEKLKVLHGKTDPEAFKRLITPRNTFSPTVSNSPKKFTIREAIESGKRLMNAKNSAKNLSPRLKITKFELLHSESESISKTPKPFDPAKDIDDVISRCKTKAKIQEKPNKFAVSKKILISDRKKSESPKNLKSSRKK